MKYTADEMFRENPSTRFVLNNFFPRKSYRLWDNVGGKVSTEDNIIQRKKYGVLHAG
jgi:hypothetical protein